MQMTCIIAAEQATTRLDELDNNIDNWARDNNLKLNVLKSSEIVFYIPGRNNNKESPPPPLPNIARVESIKVLGVTLTGKFHMSPHIDDIITSCAQSLFALNKDNARS